MVWHLQSLKKLKFARLFHIKNQTFVEDCRNQTVLWIDFKFWILADNCYIAMVRKYKKKVNNNKIVQYAPNKYQISTNIQVAQKESQVMDKTQHFYKTIMLCVQIS